MAAYVIARVKVHDPDQWEKYKALTPKAVAAYGGTFIVRGGDHQTLEGEPDDRRIVILEFATSGDARAFYDSAAYTEARAVRAGAGDMEMTVVEGV